MSFVIGTLWCLRLGLFLDWSFHPHATLTNIVILHLDSMNKGLEAVGSWEKPDNGRCSNAASDDVAPRIWRRQHSIMKTRSVSISHYKSKEILEEWLACQWFFHVAFSLKFLSSLARAGLWNYAELWKSYLTLWVDDQGEGSITKFSVIFSKKNSGHHGPSLYEGVFGPSLTSLFDVSKPLLLFIIDIYTLRSVLRHDSRQFLHLCDLDN